MKARTTLAALVAASLFALPVFAAPPAGKAPAAKANKARGAKKDPAQREARMRKALSNAGVDDARINKIVEINKRYRTQLTQVRATTKTNRENLRKLMQSKSTDEAAYKRAVDALDANRKQIRSINERRVAEVKAVLKPSEQAKVLGMMHKARGGKHGKAKGKHGKAKGKRGAAGKPAPKA